MTFDEFRRRNRGPEDPVISAADAQAAASFFRGAADDTAIDHLNKAEMNRFLEWLEGTLLIDDLGEDRA